MRREPVPPELYDLVDVASGRFAGLDLPLDEARQRRSELPGRMAVVPVRYRAPKISIDEAKARAAQALRERGREYPGVTFEEARLYSYHPSVYTFVAFSPEWRQEGRVPGGLLSSIDKADGHVWTAAEQQEYAQANAP
jgi:hypothetical protein